MKFLVKCHTFIFELCFKTFFFNLGTYNWSRMNYEALGFVLQNVYNKCTYGVFEEFIRNLHSNNGASAPSFVVDDNIHVVKELVKFVHSLIFK